jgi:hypothetical protein
LSAVERWQRHDEAAQIGEVRHPLPEGLGHLDGTRIVLSVNGFGCVGTSPFDWGGR